MNESPVLVHVWEVDPAEQAVHLPDVRETLHNLHGTANLVISLYHEVGSYSA